MSNVFWLIAEVLMKKKVSLKLLTLIISILFMVLTFVGAGYVLINHGQVNAGYAVIPMCFFLLFANISIALKKREKE